MTRFTTTGLVALALIAPLHARADERLGWDDLRPATPAENNPFERLTTQQVEWISEIARGRLMQARGRNATAEDVDRQHMLSASLATQGLDAAALLRQRDALIEQRRAAAESPVPAVSGREAHLLGHLVPASTDGRTVTDFLFVPWANACSHTRPPANQIVRIPAADLPGAQYSPSEPLVLTGRVDIRVQLSRMRFVDGEAELSSSYVIHAPSVGPLPTFATKTAAGAPAQSGVADGGATRPN